jgi:hypothetical protein
MTQTSETYAQRKTREIAQADALRKRGSRLARKLLALQIGHMDAKGATHQSVAIARFQGAIMLLAAEHGYTDHAYEMAVIGPWRANPHRPVLSHGPGGNLAYLTWEAEMAEAIDAELAKLIGA